MAEWWRDAPKSALRPVEGGIRARSRRGSIGENWWSARFVEVLEEIGDHGRLARGRSYARGGQAIAISLGPGRVTAEVQGTRRMPYDVRIEITPFSADQWVRVEEELASQAIFAAALLAGEMPVDIGDVFAAAGLSLFPATARELRTDCSCPDLANPCKHVAAVCYLLAEEFDRDPFQILAWRGRSRQELLAGLRAKRTIADGPGGRSGDTVEVAVESRAPALPAGAEAFWSIGEELESLRFLSRAPVVSEAILEPAGVPPLAAGGWALAGAFQMKYRILTRGAERLAASLDR